MIATLREVWNLGEPFTARDAGARTFHQVLSLETPRDPDTWPEVTPLPVSEFQMEKVAAGEAISTLGRHLCHGLLRYESELTTVAHETRFEPDAEISPALALDVVNRIAARHFPKLARLATRGSGKT